jgi:hypothetical protein
LNVKIKSTTTYPGYQLLQSVLQRSGYAIRHDTTMASLDIHGSFEGRSAGKFKAGVCEIKAVYRGYGGFKKMKLFLKITGQEPAEEYEGSISGRHPDKDGD